jgi:hypothetical protein
MDWRCGSSGRTPALQAQNLEFKPQSNQKKKKKKKSFLKNGQVRHGGHFCNVSSLEAKAGGK